MVNTRSTASKRLEKEQEKDLQAKQHEVMRPQDMPLPTSDMKNKTGEHKMADTCGGSSVVKSEQMVKNKPPSQHSRTSIKSKKSSSVLSLQAQKKKLELDAAKAKARIEMDLINKQLAVDLAELHEEYSPKSEASESKHGAGSDIERWMERSQQELQHATILDNDRGEPHRSDPADTNGSIQQLTTALKDVLASSTVQHNSKLLSRLGTPKELPTFYGDPKEWLLFKQAYEESTEVCKFTDKENLWRLRKCLRGAAHEAVASLLISATSPDVVMSTLQLQFGNTDVILSRIMIDIKKMGNLSVDYYREIVPFSVKVKNYVAAVRALGRSEYLQGMEVTNIILSKLPTTLLSKWADYSYPLITAVSPRPRLDVMSDFLTEEAVKVSTCSASLLHSKTDSSKYRQCDKVNNIQTLLVQDNQSEKCRYCRTSNHKLVDCKKFKKSLRKDRWLYVKRNGICYKCLVARHRKETCPVPSCDIDNCGQAHHRLLHYVPRQDNNSVPAPIVESEISSELQSETVNHINISSSVLLKVVPISIHGPNGLISASALLDDGSTVSLISAPLSKEAGLRGRRESLRVRGAFDNTELVCDAQLTNMTFSGYDNRLFTINVRIVNELNLPNQTCPKINCNKFRHLDNIRDRLCFDQPKPQILIGQDNCHLLLALETLTGSQNEPCATLTPLGWCLHGRVPTYLQEAAHHSTLFITNDATETEGVLRKIQEDVRRSFTFESMGVSAKPRQNSEDLRAENILEQTSVLIDGLWHVGLPWRDENCLLPDSFPTALNRLEGVERKMKRNQEYAQRYKERVQHLFDNNYARKLCNSETIDRTWYLPHFGVDNPNKRKLRLVFDAAAKTKGMSLNDYLIKGPDLLMSLFGIMLRFRENPIAVTGDIKDMFLRVKIRPKDQDALRFLYREQPDMPVDRYAMTSLIFGANCSPFIAQFVKNKNARRYESSMPAACTAICTNHYMDDYIDSLPNEKATIQLVREVMYIHKQGGFEMCNWTSNSQEVLDSLPKNALGDVAVRFKAGQQYEGERTLGLIWNPKNDTLGFDISLKRIPSNIVNGSKRPTKREILQVVMSIFDVYGFLSPCTINGKIILQETWKSNISWDDVVTDIIFDKWSKWLKLLQSLRNVYLPRYYPNATIDARVKETEDRPASLSSAQPLHGAPATMSEPTSAADYTYLQLHIFCDASTKALCAVAYWRWECNNNVYVTFITSRCRVVPVKPVSVPRLELQAAVLAARLAETITKEHKMKAERKIFWSDSSTTLTWIRNNARNYKQYVAHRLGEIDELSSANEWRYVPTKLNVADIATRESYDSTLLGKEWMYGPTFLRCEENQWPGDFTLHSADPRRKEDELKEEYINIMQNKVFEANLPVPDATRFSSWLRLRRATSIILKFINKCKKFTCEFDTTMEQAEILLIKQSQTESFAKEIAEINNNKCVSKTSRILTLTPYLDEHGVMRVGGRINAAAEVLSETKNPIILDGRNYIARLIVKYYHESFAHGNQETVVNEIKQRYWITRLRPVVKTVASKCMLCRIRKSKPEVPRMGDLPFARLAHHQRPFTFCGVDLFGPMEVTVGRRREKRYGVLFTCMTVRAVHLEVVASLTSDSFIMALRRMAARRGWPKYLFSDNGTNLRGANTELKRAIEALDEETLKNEVLIHGTKWTFIPAASPHWAGAWERLIRSVKTSLKIVLNERAPKSETLDTLLAEVENIVNSRPLTHVSVDPRCPETLTPNHFLIGTMSSLPQIGNFNDTDMYLRKQWRIAQRLADMYWRRWVKEVLPDMIPRSKWQSEHRNLQVGDFVVVVDPNGPRNLWPKGLIQEVHPGSDGRVRSVKIKTQSGILSRAVTRVARIPIGNECC